MKKINYFSLKFEDDFIIFLNQTKLPFKEEYIKTDDYERIAEAIERLEIRGAPLIGISAAYALSLSLKNEISEEKFFTAYERLRRTRPTAINLFWALDEIKNSFELNKTSLNIYDILISRAKEIHNDDIAKCNNIAKNGLKIFNKKSNVLTHCNTGKLATGGEGTAFAVIKFAFENGLINFVFADETRPLFQGSRLTAYELTKNNIPYSIIVDSSAASFFYKKEIDLVIVGADRIAKNGDTANKVGTYNLAVLCKHHNIPFYIAAPTSTIDTNIKDGSKIIIEERKKEEIIKLNNSLITFENCKVKNPAFDVTPHELITGIITEKGIYSYPYSF